LHCFVDQANNDFLSVEENYYDEDNYDYNDSKYAQINVQLDSTYSRQIETTAH